jgi:hypothetical protein
MVHFGGKSNGAFFINFEQQDGFYLLNATNIISKAKKTVLLIKTCAIQYSKSVEFFVMEKEMNSPLEGQHGHHSIKTRCNMDHKFIQKRRELAPRALLSNGK